jgi:Domain of unknown function (DUF6817)
MRNRTAPGSLSSPGGSHRGNAIQLLRDRHADTVQHLSGTLLDHLERTEQLLLDWGSTDALALAGLCHAAYGTDGFGTALFRLDERAVLTAAVGPDVEATIYFYASCDRGFLYPQVGGGKWPCFRDRFTGEVFAPSREQIRTFADLTLANEADVVTRASAPTCLPEWFLSLVRDFEPLASRDVADACERLISISG